MLVWSQINLKDNMHVAIIPGLIYTTRLLLSTRVGQPILPTIQQAWYCLLCNSQGQKRMIEVNQMSHSQTEG